MLKRVLHILIVFLIFLMLPSSEAKASEGTSELRSATGENYRCFVASVQMQDGVYNVLVSCRDLIYPIEGRILSYVMWATPVGNGKPIKLGELGQGRTSFRTRESFVRLFVTTEADPRTREPAGRVVMTGNIQPITFLDRATTPTPIPEGMQEEIEEEIFGPTESLTTREKLFQAIRRAGIAALLALIAIIGLIFVITRSR